MHEKASFKVDNLIKLRKLSSLSKSCYLPRKRLDNYTISLLWKSVNKRKFSSERCSRYFDLKFLLCYGNSFKFAFAHLSQNEPHVAHNYIAIALNFNLQFGVAKFNNSILPTSGVTPSRRRRKSAYTRVYKFSCRRRAADIRIYTFELCVFKFMLIISPASRLRRRRKFLAAIFLSLAHAAPRRRD